MRGFKGRRRRVAALAGAGCFGFAGVATGHDFWLQPLNFRVAPGVAGPLTIQVGHGEFRTRWSGQLERVVLLRSTGPDGVVDHRADLKPGNPNARQDADAVVTFNKPGTYVLAFESNHAASDLPAIRYNDYAKVEGLTPALELRARTHMSDSPGREIYSRRAKALIQVVGPAPARVAGAHAVGYGAALPPQPWVIKPVGLSLEIIPDRDPYALAAGQTLPVHVLFEGRPLAGALVKLTSLEFDAKPIETHLSDALGRAEFHVPHTGAWLVNVIWTKPITGNPAADFDTTFSSLTFAYQPVAGGA